MNLRFVEAFYWVATLKSVTRAAEKLFLTQSAMSARVAALEQELGVLLLDRRDRTFRLTVAGARFLTHAGRLLELQRDIKAELGAGTPLVASMRLGVIESVLHSWLIPWVERLRLEHPGLALELTVETTPLLTDHIRRGSLDVVFAALPAGADGVRTRALPAMEMAFVGNPRLHKKRRYELADFGDIDLLTFQRGSQPHVALLDQLKGAGLEPRRVHAISSISAMVQLVEGGFGIATLPLAAARRMAEPLGLRILRCSTRLPPLPIHASYRLDPGTGTTEDILKSAIDFAATYRVPAHPIGLSASRASK